MNIRNFCFFPMGSDLIPYFQSARHLWLPLEHVKKCSLEMDNPCIVFNISIEETEEMRHTKFFFEIYDERWKDPFSHLPRRLFLVRMHLPTKQSNGRRNNHPNTVLNMRSSWHYSWNQTAPVIHDGCIVVCYTGDYWRNIDKVRPIERKKLFFFLKICIYRIYFVNLRANSKAHLLPWKN